MKVVIPFETKALCRWAVKLRRVSSPLKFKNTSYLHRQVEEDEEETPWKAMEEVVLSRLVPSRDNWAAEAVN